MKLEREGRGWIWEGLWKGDKYDQNLLCETLKELIIFLKKERDHNKKKERNLKPKAVDSLLFTQKDMDAEVLSLSPASHYYGNGLGP